MYILKKNPLYADNLCFIVFIFCSFYFINTFWSKLTLRIAKMFRTIGMDILLRVCLFNVLLFFLVNVIGENVKTIFLFKDIL